MRCVVAAITDIPFTSGAPDFPASVNGVTLSPGDRVLLTAQTNAIENGIWEVPSTGLSCRAPDWDGSRDIEKGTIVFVGVSGGGDDELWQVTAPTGTILVGTTPVTLSQLVFGAGSFDLQDVTTNGETTDVGIDITDGARLTLRDPTDNTAFVEFYVTANGDNLVMDFTNIGDLGANGGILMQATGNQPNRIVINDFASLFFNAQRNAQSSLVLGETTVLRGDSAQAAVTLYGEDSGVINFGQLVGNGTQLWLSGLGTQIRISGTGSALIESDSLQLQEISAAPADLAGYGQFWVRDDAPNVPMFTNDVGDDFELLSGIGQWDTFAYNFDTATAQADPGAGNFRINNATASLATFFYIADADDDGNDLQLDVFTNVAIGWRMGFRDPDDVTIQHIYRVTGSQEFTGFWRFDVEYEAGRTGNIPANGTALELLISPQPSVELGTVDEDTLTWDTGEGQWRRNALVRTSRTAPPTPSTGILTLGATATVNELQPQIWAPANNTVSTFWFSQVSATGTAGFYMRTDGNNPDDQDFQVWGVRLNDGTDIDRFRIRSIAPGTDPGIIEYDSPNTAFGFEEIATVSQIPNVVSGSADGNTLEWDNTGGQWIVSTTYAAADHGVNLFGLGAGGVTNTRLEFHDALPGGTRNAYIGPVGLNQFDIVNELNGRPIRIASNDSGGTLRTILNADPNSTTVLRADTDLLLQGNAGSVGVRVTGGAGQLEDAGARRLAAFSIGAFVQGSADDNVQFRIADTGSNARATLGYSSADDFVIQQFVAGGDIIVNCITSGDFLVQEAGVTRFQIDNTNGRFVFNDYTMFLEERAASLADVAGYGQLWVRNDAPNVLMFTGDTGVDSRVALLDLSQTFSPDDGANRTLALSNGPWVGAADEHLSLRATTNDDNIEFHLEVADGVNNRRARFFLSDEVGEFGLQGSASSGVPELVMYVGGTQVMRVPSSGDAIFGDPAVNQDSRVAAVENSGGIEMRVTSAGAGQINQLTAAGVVEDVWIAMARNGGVSLRYNNVAQVSTGALGTQFDLPLYIFERTNANTDSAGFGQLWVRDDTPNTLMFTDDAGNDIVVAQSGGVGTVNNPMTEDLDGDNFNLDSIGALFLNQRASADTDVTDDGQVWVEDENPQRLAFTNDDGQDQYIHPITVRKTADENVNNSTTLQNDDHLVISNLLPGQYRFDMLLRARDVAVTGCGLQFDFSTSGVASQSICHARVDTFSGAAAPSFDEIGQLGDDFNNIGLDTGSGTSRVYATGMFRVTSAGSIQLRWAQNTAQVGDLRLEAQSWLTVTHLGDV